MDLENKQAFLRSEILDKGFDGNEFFNYLISLKGEEGGDLNNWQFPELENVVKQFQTNYSSMQSQQNVPFQESVISTNSENYPPKPVGYSETQTQFPQSNNNSYQQQGDSNNYPAYNIPNQQQQNIQQNLQVLQSTDKGYDNIKSNDIMEIECLPPEESALSKYSGLNVTLSFPEKTPEHSGLIGFFSKKIYISYLIQTEPAKLRVRRRYTDFEWFRNTLTKLYQGIYIPPIPLKALNEASNDNQIEKRMRALERFINALFKDSILQHSKIVYQFLSIEKDSDFAKVKKVYDQMQTPYQLNRFRSRSGKIIIDKTIYKNIKEFDQIKDNFTTNLTQLKKLSDSYKSLFTEMKQVSSRMLEISNIYNQIYTSSVKFGENDNLMRSYASMEKLMKNWGYTELKQAMNIELEVREYFKYVHLEYNSIKELYEKFDYTKNLYTKSEEKLILKKEELYKRGDVSKWLLPQNEKFDFNNKELAISKMLPNETNNVKNLKMLFYYHATSCKNEFNRMREVIGFQNQEASKLFYSKNSKVIEDLNKAWEIFKSNSN